MKINISYYPNETDKVELVRESISNLLHTYRVHKTLNKDGINHLYLTSKNTEKPQQ